MNISQYQKMQVVKRLLPFAAAFVFGIPAAVILLVLYVRVFFTGRVYPGVTAGGTGIQSLSQLETEAALAMVYSYPTEGRVELVDGQRSWVVSPAELGLVMDVPGMARQAVEVGRTGRLTQNLLTQIGIWFNPVSVEPVLILDQRAADDVLRRIAGEIYEPAVEATVLIEDLEARPVPGVVGRQLNIEAAHALLLEPLQEFENATILLPVEDIQPHVMDAGDAAAIVNSLLGQPFTVSVGGDSTELKPEELATMLTFSVEGDEDPSLQIRLNPSPFSTYVLRKGFPYENPAENARFIFNDDTRELDLKDPAVEGRKLDIDATRAAFEEALNAGEHSAAIVFAIELPRVGDNATAEELGITELVSMQSTYFGGSNSARIQNIITSSQAFHGLLVPPGGILSMAEILGDISLDTGYAEAWIIFGDRTIKGVGGGVCQVSTTLFRTAFYGGYPIVERWPHAYRVGYYEQGPGSPGPGLDASVFVPTVDFRFVNDRPDWLLLEAYVYGTQLLWKFYSTADGRSVEVSPPQISNEVEAEEPLYKENPDLKKGEIKQVDWEADGMDVSVNRTVYRDGEELFSDVIRSKYQPWRAIYEYGPETELPEDAITEEDED